MFDYSSFLNDISPNSPVGEDVRFSDDFSDIVEEVNKMSGTNWPSIIEKASGLIINNSKDIQVALYYTYARCAIDGFIGFAFGLGLIKELIEKYKSDVYPIKKNAKRNILKFFKNNVFESVITDPITDVDALEKSLSSLNSIIDNYVSWEIDTDELLPIKIKLTQKLEQLKLVQNTKENSNLEHQLQEQKDEIKDYELAKPKADVISSKQQSSLMLGTNVVEHTSITSQSDLQDHLKKVIKYYEVNSENTYLALLLRKSTKWNEITGYPISDDSKKTKLQAPRKDLISRIKTSYGQEQWNEVVELAEEYFLEKANHLWFDMQYMEYNSLLKLGKIKDYELDYIFAPLILLLNKYQELSNYSYSDGTPFASEETLKWLESIKNSQNKISLKRHNFEINNTESSKIYNGAESYNSYEKLFITEAQKIYENQGASQAIEYLQSRMGCSIFDNFQIYLQIAEITQKEKKEELTKYYLMEIINNISKDDYLFWNVSFSKRLLRFAYEVFSDSKSTSNDKFASTDTTLSLIKGLIIKIDPMYAFSKL